ncbi:MAG: SusC/RagA family TonB-linked outer membrane protein [Candidatus Kapabacteria bacterium]|nr:SusC/RagA family TonB-linked outer membrane protein [Candidatus Kapabacteria bacterium]
MRSNLTESLTKSLVSVSRRWTTMLLMLLIGLIVISGGEVLAQRQGNFIKGSVVDKESKVPLPRASVSIPDLRIGAVTDAKGNFTFEAPVGEHTVQFRYVGYETYSIKVNLKAGETREVNVTLTSQAIQTNQIVVIGLTGEVDKNQLGNIISSVSGRDVANVVSPSAIDAISGRVPGVTVTRNSGTPGAGTFITMRGRKSILGSSEPLYVVDGVIIDNTSLYDGSGTKQFSNRAVDINPQDIESMEILKGASAAAIYGSQAANGVILITTKRGKMSSFEKPAQISFSTSMTVDEKSGEVPLQTKYGQRIPWTPTLTGSSDSYGAELPAGTTTYNHAADPFRTAVSHEQSLTISGGVPQFDYLINGTYSGIQGYVQGSTFDRTSIRANIGASILPGLTLQMNNNFVTINNDLPQDGSNTSGILLGSLRSPPEFDNQEYLKADGSQRRFAFYDNPIWTQKVNTFNSKIERFIHSTDFKWMPLTGLTFNARLGMDRYEYINTERLAVGSANSENREGYILNQRITNKQMNIDLTANYQHRFLDDDLLGTIVIGNQTIWSDRRSNFAEATKTLPFYDQISAGAVKTGGSQVTEIMRGGIFTQLTGTYKDRLSLTLGVRRDGSSTYNEDKNYFYYPRISMSYAVSEESFWDDMRGVLSNFRIRGAWGEAGSPSLPDAYATNFLYGTAGFFDPWDRTTEVTRGGFSGIRPGGGTTSDEYTVAGALDILPELTIEKEIGFDMGFFDDMFNLEFTYYHQSIYDMILLVPVPTSTGFDRKLSNAAEMWNEGLEIGLRATPFSSEYFSWNTIINYSTFDNMVTKLNVSPLNTPGEYITLGGGFVGIQNIAMKGERLGTFFGYGWLRDINGKIVYSGDRIAVDENGAWIRDDKGRVTKDANGELLGDDYGNEFVGSPIQDPDQHIIGNSNPDFQISWRNDFTFYRDFTISMLWDAVMGFDVWNGTRGALYNFGTHKDTERRNEPWFNEDGNPVMDMSDPNTPVQATREQWYRAYANGFYINEPHIQDGSYIKLRELTLEYRWRGLEEWKLNAIAFNFSARNLLVITEYDGYDPEVNTFSAAEGRGFDYFTLPQVRSYRFGISIIY